MLFRSGAGRADAGVPPASTATSAVLSGLGQVGVLSKSDTSSVSAADFALVLTSGQLSGRGAAARTQRLVQLAGALDERGSGTVVAGDPASAQDGGLVAAVRNDDSFADSVSTVDNLTLPAGQISAVLAVAAEGRGDSGAYGTADNTQPVPSPAS